MDSIRLLYFPILIIQEVMRMLDPDDLINFSYASSRAKYLVQLTKLRYQIALLVLECYGIVIKSKGIPSRWIYRFKTEGGKDDEIVNPRIHRIKTKVFYKYSMEPQVEFKRLYEHIQQLLGSQIMGVSFETDCYPDQNKQMIDWVKSQQESFHGLEINSKIEMDNDLKYILNNLKPTGFLTIFSKIQKDLNVELPVNVKMLHIVHGKFVGLNQLMELQCPSITLFETSLSSHQIHAFLIKWMASETNVELKFFQIGIENRAALDVILLDLPCEVLDPDYARKFEYDFKPTRGGVLIKRNDGKSARIVGHRLLNRELMKMNIF